MARGSRESVADLYLRLGLNYDELESGFVIAERSIRDNMTRLSRENTIIDLQAQVEILGLDEAIDSTRILEIRQQALNRQLENQRDRVRLASAQLQNITERTGATSDQTQRAQLALERERLALARLEEQLESLSDTQEETNDNAGSFADRLTEIAGRFAPVIAGITAVAGGLTAAGEASKKLIEDWRELQRQAYELNMTVKDTENFLRHMRLAGGDIGDFEGYIRGISDAYVKGEWDDPEFLVLIRRYDAQLVDVNGRLKNFQDLTEEVYQAYKKAKAEGQEIEFLQLTGGESGIRDAIQYFERYEEAKEDAEKIFNAGLDPRELHEAERSLNLLTEQVGEFKDALVNIITPATNQAMKGLFEIFHDGTEILSENRTELQIWGRVAAQATGMYLNPLGELLDNFQALKDSAPTLNVNVEDNEFKQVLEGISGDLEKINDTPFENIKGLLTETITNSEPVQKAIQAQIEYNTAIQGTTKSWADFRRETEKPITEPLNQYQIQRIKNFRDELEDVQAEINNFNNDYKLSLAQLELWRKRELTDKNYVSTEERLAIEELYTAKLEQIEIERADKLEEIRESVMAEERSEIENRLVEIEREKDAWISAGMEEAEASELAQLRITKAYEDREKKLDEIREKVEALNRTELENKFVEIDRQREDWLDIGMGESEATQLAEKLKSDALLDLEKEFSEAINDLRQNDLEKQLARIEKEKQAWIDKGIEKLQAEEWAKEARLQAEEETDAKKQALLDDKKEAIEKYNEQVQKAYKDYYSKLDALSKSIDVNINSIWRTSLENRLVQIEKEKQAWIDKGVAEVKATKWAEQAKVDAQRASAMSVLKTQLEEYRAWKKGGDKGLYQYQLKQLARQGIRRDDLNMSIEQLLDFQRAKQKAERNLMPNFAANYNNGGGASIDSSKLDAELGATLARLAENLEKRVSGINDNLSKMEGNKNQAKSLSLDKSNLNQAFNIQISVNEAHAWDSEHIQELTDRVAERMTPEIQRALGGDLNGY